MSNKNKPQNDSILAIRMPLKLLTQLNALAQAKHMGTATMARMALTDNLKDEAPDALIGASPTQPKPQNKFNASQFRTPAEQRAWEEDWGE